MRRMATVVGLLTWTLLAAPLVVEAQTLVEGLVQRLGLCDASAAVAIDEGRFIVASDEENVLRVFGRGDEREPTQGFDMSAFLMVEQGKPEADIEGATQLGDRIYWITSHARNKDGEYRGSRYRLWATQVDRIPGKVQLYCVGSPYLRLLDDLLAAPQFASYNLRDASIREPKSTGALNIEGLAATPRGELLIGFRNPIPNGRALLVPLLNPGEVIDGGRGRLGNPIELPLRGLGIRSIEYWPERQTYVIVAGAYDDGSRFGIFFWSGEANAPPRELSGIELGSLQPEGLILYPGETSRFQLLSDDGTRLIGGRECKEVPNLRARSFRTVWIVPDATELP